MKYLATLAAVGYCASPCAAASFGVNACDAGVISGAVGNPISWSGTGTTTTSPGLLAPTSVDILANPALEFTSYFGMDPWAPPRSATAPTAASAWYPAPPWHPGPCAESGSPSPSSPAARATACSSPASCCAPDTVGLDVNIQDSATGISGVVGNLRFRASHASSNAGLWAQPYCLDYVTSSSGSGTRYAIYIVAVPTPGFPAGLGAATLLIGARRRR